MLGEEVGRDGLYTVGKIAVGLMSAFRRLALSGTAWARAQCDTIQLQLLRIGRPIRISVR
jgi:hypothetical protein